MCERLGAKVLRNPAGVVVAARARNSDVARPLTLREILLAHFSDSIVFLFDLRCDVHKIVATFHGVWVELIYHLGNTAPLSFN